MVSLLRLLPVATIYCWVLLSNNFLSDSSQYAGNHYIFWLLIIVSFGALLLSRIIGKKDLLVSELDLLIFLYVLASVISNIHFTTFTFAGNESQENLLIAYLFYLTCRNSVSDSLQIKGAIAILVFSFIVECSVAATQFFYSRQLSADAALSITGSLGNSGIMGGFLMILSPLLFYYAQKTKRKPIWNISITIFLIIILTITRSRAACYSLLVIILFLCRLPVLNWYKGLPKLFQIVYGSALVLILASSIVWAFQFKTDSALGRLVIWKISLPHILDNPIRGIGYGKFSHLYCFWQAEYFQHHPEMQIPEGRLVTIPSVSFNDPLQMLLETGIIGLGLFAFLNAGVLYSGFTGISSAPRAAAPIQPYISAVVLALISFSFFSYPLHSIPILYAYLLLLAVAARLSSKKWTIRLTKWQWPTLAIALAIGLLFITRTALKRNQSMMMWEDANDLTGIDNRKAIDLYNQAFPDLNHISLFLHEYATLLYSEKDYARCIPILEAAKLNMAGIETLLLLGKAYTQLNEYEKAKTNFVLATRMVPGNFESNYLLVKLYLANHQEGPARLLAKKIVTMPVKVPSAAIDQIISEMNALLQQNP